MPQTYDYPRPALTADVVLVTRAAPYQVLLIRRAKPPFARHWALPGGFVDEGETLEEAARRELREEAGIEIGEVEQLHMAGNPGRDPRGWTVSAVFLARADEDEVSPTAGDDAGAAKWFPLAKPPKMAFDHADLLARATTRLADRRP